MQTRAPAPARIDRCSQSDNVRKSVTRIAAPAANAVAMRHKTCSKSIAEASRPVEGRLHAVPSQRAMGGGVMRELEQLSGAMIVAPRSTATRPSGLATQFVNGGLLAPIYL